MPALQFCRPDEAIRPQGSELLEQPKEILDRVVNRAGLANFRLNARRGGAETLCQRRDSVHDNKAGRPQAGNEAAASGETID